MVGPQPSGFRSLRGKAKGSGAARADFQGAAQRSESRSPRRGSFGRHRPSRLRSLTAERQIVPTVTAALAQPRVAVVQPLVYIAPQEKQRVVRSVADWERSWG